MGTASAPAPDDSGNTKSKVGPGAVRLIDEASKWHGRLTTVQWLLGLLAIIFPSAVLWINNTSLSYLHTLGKTAPLTIAVILLALIFRSSRMGLGGYALTTIVVLAASALVSQLLGMGAPVDWRDQSAYLDTSGNLHPSSWAGIPGTLYWLVLSFFNLYHAGPFFTSVITGLIAGVWLSGKVRA